MDCFNCKEIYNENDRIPRLLIQCGHSICEQCSIILHKDCLLICPECKAYNYAASYNNFPKNLALLLVKNKPVSSNSNSSFLEKNKESTDFTNLCQEHHKYIEGLFNI